MSRPHIGEGNFVRRELGTVVDFHPQVGIGTIAIDDGPLVKVRQTEVRPRTVLRFGDDLTYALTLIPGQRVSCELDREFGDSLAAWNVVIVTAHGLELSSEHD